MIVPVLSVKDVDATLAFYAEKLGFKTDMVLAGPDGANVFAGTSLGKATFMISRHKEGEDASHHGNGVVFMVYLPEDGDIDALYADVKRKGVAILEELKTEYWGDRIFSVKDPDGYFLTISKTVEQTDMERVEKVMRGEIEA